MSDDRRETEQADQVIKQAKGSAARAGKLAQRWAGTSAPDPDDPPPRPRRQRARMEIEDASDVSGIDEVDWLVDGYFEDKALSLIFGDPGCGKSFLAFDVALSVATGTAWHGRGVRQGSVLIVAGEGKQGTKRRFAAWQQARGVHLAGCPIYITSRSAAFADPDGAAEVIDAVERLTKKNGRAPDVIIVDTLARNFGGGDENSTRDMGLFVQQMDEMKDEYDAGVIIVHHTGHMDKGRARGSIALKGAVDAEYGVTKTDGVVKVTATKMKEADNPPSLFFKLEVVDLGIGSRGGQITSCVLQPIEEQPEPERTGKAGRGRNQTLALTALRKLEAEHRQRLADGGYDQDEARVKEDDWRAALEASGINRYRFREIRLSLIASRMIASEAGGYVRTI